MQAQIINLWRMAKGFYPAAEPFLNQSLNIRRDTLPEKHPEIADSLDKRALAIRQKCFGTGHPAVTQSLENLAAVYRTTGRTDEAAALLKIPIPSGGA